MRKTFLILIILIVLMLVAGGLSQMRQGRRVPDTPFIPAGDITLEGIYICLPHRDTTGPQTMECALGIAGDDGHNYSLDFNEIGVEETFSIGTGSRIHVEGIATPASALSTDMWWKYDMIGIITVKSITRI